MIQLEPFLEIDYNRFIGWIDNENFMCQFAGPAFSFPITKEQLFQYTLDKNRKIYKVINTSNEVVGHCEINRVDLTNKSARLCRILIGNERDRNKGYGKMIINELLRICFDKLNLHRVDLGVFDFNKSAIKCYESCGFRIEGLLRDSFIIDNQFYSTYNMSILKDEYQLKKITKLHIRTDCTRLRNIKPRAHTTYM